MTEAMPFLQEAILLSYAPRPLGPGFFRRDTKRRRNTLRMFLRPKESRGLMDSRRLSGSAGRD